MNLTTRKFNGYMGAEAVSTLNGNARLWYAGCCCCCCSAMCEIAE